MDGFDIVATPYSNLKTAISSTMSLYGSPRTQRFLLPVVIRPKLAPHSSSSLHSAPPYAAINRIFSDGILASKRP
jgi:hypothetical protein